MSLFLQHLVPPELLYYPEKSLSTSEDVELRCSMGKPQSIDQHSGVEDPLWVKFAFCGAQGFGE
jgi:hypothetical protein